MNQFAIFSLLAFIYISYAPTQAVPRREKVCKIKKAKIDPDSINERPARGVFDDGDVYLFKEPDDIWSKLKFFMVEDESGQLSDEFPIFERGIVVTKDSITMYWNRRTITLTFENTDTFALYKTYSPLRNVPFIQREFTVTSVYQDGEKLSDLTAIKAKQIDEDEEKPWLLEALEGNKPRLIFSNSRSELLPKENSDDVVSFDLRTKPGMRITFKFDDSTKANNFYKFFKEEIMHVKEN